MNWLEFAAVLFFAVGFMFPTCTCCPSPCAYCSTDAPAQVQLVISGNSNNSCTDCGNWNNTYILDRYTSGGNYCYWEVDASDGCGWTKVSLDINNVIGTYATVFHPSGTPRAMGWRSIAAGYDDCANWSSFQLSYVAPTFPAQTLCTSLASLCDVTAL